MNDTKVFVALDFEEPVRALALADGLDPAACGLKIGKELFVVAGPELVRWVVARGFRVFLDLTRRPAKEASKEASEEASKEAA